MKDFIRYAPKHALAKACAPVSRHDDPIDLVAFGKCQDHIGGPSHFDGGTDRHAVPVRPLRNSMQIAKSVFPLPVPLLIEADLLTANRDHVVNWRYDLKQDDFSVKSRQVGCLRQRQFRQ